MLGLDRRFVDVVVLGLSFMLLFTAFQTCGMVQTLVLQSVVEDEHGNLKPNSETHGLSKQSGYYSLAIIYACFTVCNVIVPPIIGFLGPKLSMIFASLTYVLFLGSFLRPMGWFLYLCSALLGLGAAVIWTGQGNYLTLCSDEKTIGRNSGVLWALLQCSLLIGSIFIYFEFSGEETISARSRTIVYGAFTALGGCGMLLMILLRNSKTVRREHESRKDRAAASVKEEEAAASVEPVEAEAEVVQVKARTQWLDDFLKMFKLIRTKEMILLSVAFLYTGFELTFYSGVYGTMLGRTLLFGDARNSFAGLNGIFIGIGEITGGLLFGILGHRTIRWSRNPIIFLGFFCHIVVYMLIMVNLPADSPIGNTGERAYLDTPNVYLAMLCSLLLGFADSCWNTQCYSIIGSVYPNDSAPAFALFKFFQSLAAALGFAYSAKIRLYWQLLILVVFDVLGAVSFFQVEWWIVAARRNAGVEGYEHF